MVDKAQRAETERAILEATRAAHDELQTAQQAARGAKTVLRRAAQAVAQARAAIDAATNEAAKGMARGALRRAEAKEAEVRKEVGTGGARQKAVEQAERTISALGQLPGMLAEARGEAGKEKKNPDVPNAEPKTTGKWFKIPASDTKKTSGKFFKVPGN